MKTLSILNLCLLLLLNTVAQKTSADDVILKLNGDEMIGKVTEVNDSDIKFTYKGETVSYSIKKADILKITFSSGRIEFFNKPALPSQSAPGSNAAPASATTASPEEHHNKIAILPFKFITEQQTASEEMSYTVQGDAYKFLNTHSANMDLQDPATTNALLLKAGINLSNVRSFTPAEICNTLGVEYIVQGVITQTKGAASTIQSGSGSANTRYGKSGNNTNTSIYGSSTTTVTQSYKTNVALNITSDKGATLFNDNHTAFWSSEEAYKNAIRFLLKKTPVYKK